MKISYQKHAFWFHLGFWLVYFIVALSIFIGFFNIHFAVIRVVTSGVAHAILIYANLYFFIPRFFMKGKLILHYTLLGLLLAIISIARVYVDDLLNGPAGIIPIEMFSWMHYGGKALSGIIVIGFSSSFKFIQYWYQQQKKEQELKSSQLEAELKLLKAQVNPHFLFNALNNIYSLAYTKEIETSSAILKLSDLMRYMLYESNDQVVPLEKEVSYLKNYIELQQLKKSSAQNISFEVKGDIQRVKIAPMLLIPFFENSFKHGNIDETGKGFLKSQLDVSDGEILFSISNSVSQNRKPSADKGGIGLENVKKRLKLLYPARHELKISNEKNIFEVTLKIQTA